MGQILEFVEKWANVIMHRAKGGDREREKKLSIEPNNILYAHAH